MNRVRFLLITMMVALLSRLSFAGPPFVTDDPEPVELRHWEVYLASQHLHDDRGWSGTAPHIEINYGALPNVQLHLIAPYSYSKPSGLPEEKGYGDTETGIKWRFIDESGHRPQVGTFPLVELPTGNASKGLGSGHTLVFLPLWLQKSWGPWTSYGGGGYWFNPGEGQKNWTLLGWELQRDLSKHLTLGGEWLYRTADSDGASSADGFNLGGQVNFDDVHHFLFSAGKDVRGPNRLTGYVAFQWTFPSAPAAPENERAFRWPFSLVEAGSTGT